MVKTPEFLDAMCVFQTLDKNWYLIEVAGYGNFVWHENDHNKVFKIHCLDLWLDEQKIVKTCEPVNCPVRNVIPKRATITAYASQPIELWINVIVPETIDGNIRVEPYLNQFDALRDAEQELLQDFEVHTKRVSLRVP